MHKITCVIAVYPVAFIGILIAIAFVLGLWTAARRGMRDGLHPDQIMDLGPWLIIGTIVGARAWYVITYWQDSFAGRPLTEIFMVQHGGLVFYGGLVGATLATLITFIAKSFRSGNLATRWPQVLRSVTCSAGWAA